MSYLKLGVIALVLGVMFWLGTIRGDAKANAAKSRAERAEDNAEIARDALVQAMQIIETERAAAKRANAIAAQYEQDKINAEADAQRTVADLRAGNLRLRDQWQGCKAGLPQANGTPGEPDASADDRAESAGRIVRAADEADAQIKGLQDFIRSERK